MAFVEDDIERVRASTSIVEVIQQYVALRKAGRNWVGLCPFHTEKSGSFNVREETGRYKCFGCQAAGDIFTFVQEIEHIDFVSSVEKLAARANITLTYTTGGESQDRQRRKKLISAMAEAVDWYHQRLLHSPDARAARDYLRDRGLAGDVARQFQLGYAPDEWDALSQHLVKKGFAADVLSDVGLAFTNKANRLQDSFRARIMFPIFSDNGDPVAFGGRVLPGSTDPAKYKNSSETKVYFKSKTLYGLNWAKNDVVKADQVIVCEGYTDVIGFHRSGVTRAVATCGTSLTEEHVRILKRFASKVVLAFDADAAGQGAAEKFYEWEKKYQVQVSVAKFPDGKDPGDLAISDPAALAAAIDDAVPFLGFRVNRVVSGKPLRSPEDRARLAAQAMEVINEHPDVNVRKLYAGEVAARVGLPVADLSRLAERRSFQPVVAAPVARGVGVSENAEFIAISLLLQNWDDIAPWLIEALFASEIPRRAFLTLATASEIETGSLLTNALGIADPEVREMLERAAVADIELEPSSVALNLIGMTVRRILTQRTRIANPDEIREDRDARVQLENLDNERTALGAAESLLMWLAVRTVQPGVKVTIAKNDASNYFAETSLIPVVGIDEAEWSALIAFGQRQGELSTEDIVEALRDIELSPEVIDSVRTSIEKIGIRVDQSFELDDSGELRRPSLSAIKSNSQKQKSSRHERGGDDAGQDAIRMYLQEISRIALLTADEEKVLGRKIVLGSEAHTELESLGEGVSTLDRRRLQRVIDQGRRAREDLTNANLRLVVSIAKRYTKVSMPLADAIQSGNIGLMKAVEKFDYTRGFKFSTYATWWIKQAISRAVAEESRNIRIPTHAMENINRALRVQRELTQLNQREPTIIEIAKAIGESPDRVAEYFSLAADTTSLDQPTRADGDSTIADHIASTDAVDPSGGIELEDMREAMRVVLDELPEREREVMKMRFGLNVEHSATLEEVGQAFNITRERVRQIEVRALFRLRHVASGQALRNFVEE